MTIKLSCRYLRPTRFACEMGGAVREKGPGGEPNARRFPTARPGMTVEPPSSLHKMATADMSSPAEPGRGGPRSQANATTLRPGSPDDDELAETHPQVAEGV